MSSRYNLRDDYSDAGGGGGHERGGASTSNINHNEEEDNSFTRFLVQQQQQGNGSGGGPSNGSKWLSASAAGGNPPQQTNSTATTSLGTTSLVVDLRARVAELEYELAVTVDKLSDMTRGRDQLQEQLTHLAAASSARHDVQRALEGVAPLAANHHGNTAGTNGISTSTMKHIARASDRFSAVSNTAVAAAHKSGVADVAEDFYTLQRNFAKLSEDTRKKDVEIAKLSGSVKRLQENTSNQVNQGVFEIEKELVNLRRELAAEREKSDRLRQDSVMVDAVLREKFNLEDMSQSVSHTILIPSDALFHRLRTDHRRNNFLSSKYDVSVEFTAAAGRSVVLRGKRLNVELLKGEIYAVLNEMHSAKITGGMDGGGARSQNVAGLNATGGGMMSSDMSRVGGGGGTVMDSNLNGGGSQVSGMMSLTATARGKRGGASEEVDHLCSTIATHEATIEALHTAMRHAQDKASAAEKEARMCRDTRDEFEEQAKNAEVLKRARESELGHRVVLLEKQLVHAEEANQRAVNNSKEESKITQQYRDENEKLRDEIAELIESREVAERSCYVANEHSKLLSIKEQESTRAAASALSDKAHVERLTQQLEDARNSRDGMVERLAKEAGELKLELRRSEELCEASNKKYIENSIALEAAQHEVGVHKELVEELRHRLIKMIHSQTGGVGGNTSVVSGGGGGYFGSTSHGKGAMADDPTELVHRSGKMLREGTNGNDSHYFHHNQSLRTNNNLPAAEEHNSRSTLASAFFHGDHGSSSSVAADGLMSTPRTGTNPRGGVSGRQLMNASSNNHLQTTSDAVLVDKLFMENDSLKKELQRSHEEVREVAHSLKETRHIRELTAKELEKLQKQRSHWMDEKATLQRTRMEEQLVARQMQAEAEMKFASSEDNLAQVKKRGEVLHEQLLKEQRSAHEALMRAESAESAMAAMHRDFTSRSAAAGAANGGGRNTTTTTSGNAAPPSASSSTAGSVSTSKPKSDVIRRSTTNNNNIGSSSTQKQRPVSTAVTPPVATTNRTSASGTSNPTAKTNHPNNSNYSTTMGPSGAGTASSSAPQSDIGSSRHQSFMGVGGGSSDTQIDDRATTSDHQQQGGGGILTNSCHAVTYHQERRGSTSNHLPTTYQSSQPATPVESNDDNVIEGGPFGGPSSAKSIYSPEGRSNSISKPEEAPISSSSKLEHGYSDRAERTSSPSALPPAVLSVSSELEAARAASRNDVEQSLQDILAKYKGVGNGGSSSNNTAVEYVEGIRPTRSTLSELADNRDVFKPTTGIQQQQQQYRPSSTIARRASDSEASSCPSPVSKPPPRRTQQLFNYTPATTYTPNTTASDSSFRDL